MRYTALRVFSAIALIALVLSGSLDSVKARTSLSNGERSSSTTQSSTYLPLVTKNYHYLPPIRGIVLVTAGGVHTCALTTSSGVKCWGYNTFGQLGDDTTTERLTPVDVVGLGSGVSAIAMGEFHTCALTASGGVRCWGGNWSGQLGDGATTERPTPVDVVELNSGVAAIAAGEGHTCAVTASGGVKCWGYNWFGQLGDGTTMNRLTPVDVVGTGGDSYLSLDVRTRYR